MAFSYGFFNSKGLDRTYTAENFCDYLGSIICNGIQDNYGKCFSMTVSTGFRLALGTGKAWIDGHYFINDAPYSIDLASYQDESLPRIITISIVLNTSDSVRNISVEVAAGTPAESPSMPTFSQNDNITRLILYSIRLNPNAVNFVQSNLNDLRNNERYCGYVRCILGKCHVSEMLDEMWQIKQDISGLKDGTLTAEVKKLRQYLFNTADRVNFKNDENGAFIYYGSDGKPLTGEQEIGGIPYQFAPNGVLQTGWRTVAGKRYYYDQITGNIKLGWLTYNDRKYYITLLDGKLVNQYHTIDGTRYWFDSYGVATAALSRNYPDVDGDGVITSLDASETLSFYSECATGKYTNDEAGWQKYLADKKNGGDASD